MATEEGGPLVVDVPSRLPKSADHACGPAAETPLKRKASLSIICDSKDDGDDTHDGEDTRSKRQRQDAEERPSPPREAEPRPLPESPPRRRPSSQDTSRDRRESAIQEEKKRGRRLFGGLLSTLSQTSTNSHHKRRQEIERRQQERLQRQREQDDQKRAEKLSKIREARLMEQVDFQEQVMRHRHTKMLALAEYLKTKTEPAIYYLPWKRTTDQGDVIAEQTRAAKSTIAHEEEEFKALKERHAIRYGLRRDSHQRQDTTERAEGEGTMQAEEAGRIEAEATQAAEVSVAKEHAEVQKAAAQHDAHDESGDVLVDGDEDMVIY
ncbi:hypothetical protein E4U42_007399 [Claviceps africana]|uniref:Pinin/SDK/MemA protein domain-containing protein n=1 Tax=Claviceps africana TaxID=83212 RepID=A0A8K0NIK3_9HYPO|nr:hypothetical protein E4U42_007399 [Claviceps africana]